MVGLLLQLVFFAVAAVGVWVCGRTLLEVDRRYADELLPATTTSVPTIDVRATTPVVASDTASAPAPAPIPPPPTREPEPAAMVA